MAGLQPEIAKLQSRLLPTVRKELKADPSRQWTAPVATLAAKLATMAPKKGR